MTIRKLTAAAGLVLAAEAFMIPSTMSLPGLRIDENDDNADFHALRMPDELSEQLKNLHIGVSKPHIDSAVTHVALNCPGCSFRPEGVSADEVDPSVANDVILDFDLAADRHALNLNGVPLYPFQFQNGPMIAHQSAHDSDATTQDRALDYQIFTSTMDAADGTDAQLIDLVFKVTGLDGEDVSLDTVNIRMLQDEAANLHLVHLITAPTHGEPNGNTLESEVHNPPPQSKDDCDFAQPPLAHLMCKLRQQVQAKVKDWRLMQPNGRPHKMHKPCPGRLRYLQDHPQTGDEVQPFIKGGPLKFMPFHNIGHHHGHHGHHASGFMHVFARVLRGFVIGFVVPILIGVTAGMTASLLGMLVGTFIAWLWVKLVRGGKRGNASARQEERAALVEEEILVGEKDGLLLEHAPAYEEVEALPVYAEKE